MKGWPANPELVRHLKSNLIRTCVHVDLDEAVMGLSVHADGDGEGDNPLLLIPFEELASGSTHVNPGACQRAARLYRTTFYRHAYLQL